MYLIGRIQLLQLIGFHTSIHVTCCFQAPFIPRLSSPRIFRHRGRHSMLSTIVCLRVLRSTYVELISLEADGFGATRGHVLYNRILTT
jgi:hypothetical protein